MFRKMTTNLMVEDVNRTVDFYSNVLGFEFVMGVLKGSQDIIVAWKNDEELNYAMMRSGDVDIMFQSEGSMKEDIPGFSAGQIGGSLTLYIEVDDIEDLYSNIRENVNVVKELECTFYGMQEFYIKDCNGYVLGFAESL